MLLLFVIIAFGLLFFIKLPSLTSKEYRWDLIVFTFLMFIAFMISLLAAMGVKFPYVSTAITNFFKSVFHL